MSTFQPSTILIFGGTGTIGRFITTCIIRAASLHKWTVLLFTSRTPRSSEMSVLLYYWMAQGLNEVIEGDVASAADVRAAYARGVDTVVSALGRGALHRQLELLRLADEEASGVRWFFPSEYGTDVEHNARSAAEQPHQMKLRVRQFVREEIKRVKVTYMVTGPYFDMWVDTVPGLRVAGGFVKETKEAFVINEGQDRVGFCTMWDVGKSVVAALTHPETSVGKTLRVQSFVATPNEVVAEYERQTGAKWKVTKTPLYKIKEWEAQAWKNANPRATSITLRRIWAEGGTLYSKNDNELVGLEEVMLDSLEMAVAQALAGGYRKETFDGTSGAYLIAAQTL